MLAFSTSPAPGESPQVVRWGRCEGQGRPAKAQPYEASQQHHPRNYPDPPLWTLPRQACGVSEAAPVGNAPGYR